MIYLNYVLTKILFLSSYTRFYPNSALISSLLFCFFFLCPAFSFASTEVTTNPTNIVSPAIVPIPKNIQITGKWVLSQKESITIQIGSQAIAPETYAAERLVRDLKQKFKLKATIRKTNKLPQNGTLVVILGTRHTNPLVKKYTSERALQLEINALGGKAYGLQDEVGLDGYIIDTFKTHNTRIALVGGLNGRAVIYGADTLFQLMRRADNAVEIIRAKIRDWASIPWRGSVSSLSSSAESDPDHDARIRSRLNFVDIRYPNGWWISAGKIKEPTYRKFKRSAQEAHRRGMLVYVHIMSGAKSRLELETISREFKRLFALGGDRMWIGYDDRGGGPNPVGTANALLVLAESLNLSGRGIAHTPPEKAIIKSSTMITGTYKNIKKSNSGHQYFISRVPGMENTLYYITQPPTMGRNLLAKRAGLAEGKYAWWHNWPRYEKGVLHKPYGGHSYLSGSRPAYYGLVPISNGWHKPKSEHLIDAKAFLSAVFLNSTTGGKQPDYIENTLGFWAWHPERFEWQQIRRAIYSRVFGVHQAEIAEEFDSKLNQFEKLFNTPDRKEKPRPSWLKNKKDRTVALRLVNEMGRILRRIEQLAPAETELDKDHLQAFYLEPMRSTVHYGHAMATLDFPEYYFPPDLGKVIIRDILSGSNDQAKARLSKFIPRVSVAIKKITIELSGLQGIQDYTHRWQDYINYTFWKKKADVERKMRAERKARREKQRKETIRKMPARFKKLLDRDFSSELAFIDHPPTKRRVIAEVSPQAWKWQDKTPFWRGDWAIGRYQSTNDLSIAIAYPPKTKSRIGDFAEVRATVPVPDFDGRLKLMAFINDTLIVPSFKSSGYRYMQLWVNDRKVWEEDIAFSRNGNEWISVDITETARSSSNLNIRFRVEDRRGVSNYKTVSFLGPILLKSY